MDLAPQLTEAWTAVTTLLSRLDDSEWMADTPCDGWTVHDVAAHLGHIEGAAFGFDQPEPPDDFDPKAFPGLSAMTEIGVAARRSWSHAKVLDEIRRASAATLDLVGGLDDEGWEQPFMSPIGMLPMHQTQDLRLADVYVHLLDMRVGLGMGIDATLEPLSAGTVVARAIRLTGWGAVKGAGLADGTRVHLEISGPGGGSHDLVVDGGRGRLVAAGADAPADRIAGPGLAYVMAVSGRTGLVEAAGGLEVTGESAMALLDGYRLFL